MKTSIHLLAFCLICNWAVAQAQSKTIKVSSKIVYIDPDPVFKADVSLSNAFSSFDNNMMNLDQIKAYFKKSLEENGLSWKNVKEHPGTFGFETMGYQKPGVIYEYETKSVEDMKRFLNIKLPILQPLSASSTIEIDHEEAQKIAQMAFDKAFKKANLLAKTLNKQVGDILIVEENSSLLDKPYSVALFYDRPPGEFFYDIVVTYELK
ncbi:hypothetical protein [Yeosuana marina]|uniref:hypothetical protein n=1 Tax=Yeosuana marina TaxID=1565536 RepID=UPI0030EC3703|tara:strand:- start:1361 stop:1984 length:624 start_codon:yes stop_codon:yes gene_type:complete